jgi:hypothetical protein
VLLALAIQAGCVTIPVTSISAAGPSTPSATSRPSIAASRPAIERLPPLLLHLPGIGGKRSFDLAMVRGFVKGGFTGDVQIYDWTEGDSGIGALRAMERNKREARLIAAALLDRHVRDPSAKVYLTCHSGGAGLAVWALEDLPSDVMVQSIVFMSPALSPTYDLTRALRHVLGHAYVFSSLSDNLVLGYGTRVFGTIDGVQTDAAGRVGFQRPPSGDPEQYKKIVSLPYDPAWERYHNFGDHVGGMGRLFAQAVLAPLVRSGIVPIYTAAAPTTMPDAPRRFPVPATLPHLGRGPP